MAKGRLLVVLLLVAAALIGTGLRFANSGTSDRDPPVGQMRCDDDAGDYRVNQPPGTTGDLGSLAFGDLASVGLASDGERVVISIRMQAERTVIDGPAAESLDAGVLLFFGEDAFDHYTVSFDWQEAKVELAVRGGAPEPVQRFTMVEGRADAELPISDVSLLPPEFRWSASTLGARPVSADGAADVAFVEDACPGAVAGDEQFRFVSERLPDLDVTSSSSIDSTTSSSGEASQGEADALVGLTASGGGGGSTYDPGESCTDSVSACSYYNAIDLDELESSIADTVAPVLGARPDVDCHRANDQHPNKVREGKTFTCLFDVDRATYAEVTVTVEAEGAWRWIVARTGGD